MIDIYFIRHGQTGGNVAKRHQLEETRLTPHGKEQARQVGEFVATLAPTHVITSSRVRTLETASIIVKDLDIIPESSVSFVELKRPDRVYGFHHRSVRSVRYLTLWYLGLVGGDGSNGDGESYKAFRDRMHNAQAELAQLPDDSRVIVVSHAVFISFLLVYLCNPKRVSLINAVYLFRNLLRLRNGSVSHVRLNPHAQPNTCAWELVTYNQHSHLSA